MGKIRQSFTVREKLKVISYAEVHGNRAAGREFNMNETNVRQWRRLKDRLQKMPRSKMADRGSSAHFPELEAELLQWVTDRRLQGYGISTSELRLKGLHLAKKTNNSNFHASVAWSYAFLKRHHLSIRRRTHIAQKLPSDYEDQLTNFQSFIIGLRKKNNYDLSQIGNADQTPLTFDLPSDTTIAPKGSSTVTIKTTGNEKNRFTVMLACTADGGKLPPYVVFKRKTMPKLPFPKGIIVQVHEKGWFDDKITKDWLQRVWQRRPGAGLTRSMHVLDAFRYHRSDNVKSLLNNSRTDLAIIPGGMTSILQPLDVSINKPMKTALRQKWNSWIQSDDHSFTAGGRMRKAGFTTICNWIIEAWQELDPAIIQKAFKKCTISNALDGSEDDIVWQDSESTTYEDEDEDDQDLYYQDEEDTPLSVLQDMYRLFREDGDDDEFDGF